MYYEITVTLDGKHLFATAERSLTNKEKAIEVYKMLRERFYETEGFKIFITKWEHNGTIMDILDLCNE